MPKFCHFVTNNRVKSTISTGRRQKVMARHDFIFGPIAIKFYMDTQRTISFHMSPRLPDLDEKQKSWHFVAEGPMGHSSDSKGPQGFKTHSIVRPIGRVFYPTVSQK